MAFKYQHDYTASKRNSGLPKAITQQQLRNKNGLSPFLSEIVSYEANSSEPFEENN